MDVQQTMFPELAPEVELALKPVAGTALASRAEGWVLVGRRNRTPSWHKAKARPSKGTIITECDLTGWEITEPGTDQALPCPDCKQTW